MGPDGNGTGILLFAHGSSVPEANDSIRALAGEVETRGPYTYVRAAFLELAHPSLAEAIDEAVKSGVRRIIVVPYFLTMGIHLRRDLPKLMAPPKKKYPDLTLETSQPLEGHPLMASIILERAREVTGATRPTR